MDARITKALTRTWPISGPSFKYVKGGTPLENTAEHVIHELCHAAVFGIADPKALGWRLPDRISDRFWGATSADRRQSDLDELKAIAVEFTVVRKLGLNVDEEALCYDVAWKTRALLVRAAWKKCLPKLMRRRTTKFLANTVLNWIKEVT